MQLRDRQYSVDPELLKRQRTQWLVKRAGGAVDDAFLRSLDSEELMKEWMTSERFRSLGSREQAIAARAVSACMDGSQWSLGVQSDETGLFPVEVPVGRVPTAEHDALILSGALGALVGDYYQDDNGGKSIWRGTGRKGGLEDLKLLGALVNQAEIPGDAGSMFELKNENAYRSMIYVGADLHGDFAMWQVDGSEGVAHSPGGVRESFSPNSVKKVRAYHSVELDMVESALTHLGSVYDDTRLLQVVDEILDKVSEPIQDPSRNFGDYGSHSNKVRHIAALWRVNRESDTRPKRGGVLDSFIVTPDRRSYLQMLGEDEGIVFRMVEKIDDPESESVEIFIPDENITDLVAAIASADRGRTAPEEIIELLLLMREELSK